ncbi:MAG TPA: thioredoxin [Candidatus Prevotella avicola]|uniref:Thioredoxin n=1 Tax=Candidatus Prevotella avicola TaxID=2838738 RepID=A0A9D2JVR1_9BACT|nr:thioredoxin [Candidatus Prevotella avicola]
MKAKNLTKSEFVKRVADIENNPNSWDFLGERPAIIDFYATWCGPCKMLAPVLDEIAAEYEGRIDVYKVNVEEEEELAALFGIRSVPSILFVPMSGKPRMAQGALPKKTLDEAVNNILLSE